MVSVDVKHQIYLLFWMLTDVVRGRMDLTDVVRGRMDAD